ncbi:putative reticulon-4 receptor-like 2 [Sesbania bispinosa]|nr:putative reticulon-4 receptor-like 2 [Sesbania bispinosa]
MASSMMSDGNQVSKPNSKSISSRSLPTSENNYEAVSPSRAFEERGNIGL